jgi:hypothetical protein
MSRRAVWLAAGAVGIVLVALATQSSATLGGGNEELTAPIRSLLARGALGAMAVAGAGAIAFAIWRARHRDESLGSALRRTLPWLLALCGLGALLGAATTPLRPRDPELAARQARNPTIHDGERRLDHDGNLRRDDVRRFGAQLQIDRYGNRRVVIDRDGDGRADTVLVPCPESQPMRTDDSLPPIELAIVPTSELVPIDNECDGDVDGYARIEEEPPVYVDEFDSLPEFDRLPDLPSPTPDAPPKVDSQRLVGDIGNLTPWLLGVLGVAALGGIVWIWSASRRRPAPEVPREPEILDLDLDRGAATRAVGSTLDAMLDDPDPRTAIIGAYAMLLDGLADVGLARQAHEAPEEYLARASAALAVDPSGFATLTDLFSIARYSSLPMTSIERDAAIRALRATVEQLGVESAGTSV